jgi:hypothetical protein
MTFYPCTQCQLWNDGFQEGSNLTLFRILCRHDMHTYVLSCQGCIIVVEGTHLAHWWTLQLMLLDVSICSWILWPFWGKLVVWVCLGWQGFNILFCEYAQIPYFRYHHWLSTLETFWQIRDALWWFRYAPFTFSFAYLLLIADSGRSIWLMLTSIHLWVLLGFWHFQQIAVWILSCLELLDKASLIFICGCPPPGIEILNLLVEGGELTFVVKTQLTNWFWGKWQIPGWSGLANARVTIFGDVYPLPEDQQVATRSSSSNWIVRKFINIIVKMMMSSLNCTFLLWHSRYSSFAGPCT